MKQDIAIYTLTSELHDEKAVTTMTTAFLESLGIEYQLKAPTIATMAVTPST